MTGSQPRIAGVPRFLAPTLPDRAAGGRVGGPPPVALEEHPILDTHRYLMTLPADIARWTGGAEVSLFLRAGFSIGDDDLKYPNLSVHAIMHAPSPRGRREDATWPGLRAAALEDLPGSADTAALVRVDDAPVLMQQESSYADAVRADGHSFLFQVDEVGWPVDGELGNLIEEYLWGYGTAYFYGTPDAHGVVRDIVAGFIDF